ncbi:MAG: hypothetical protein OEL79_06250, partial [Chromatiales bacterium]|nr:hypothetical protein [Chromatiales bacterium]
TSGVAATGTLVTGDTGGNTIGVNWGRWDGSYTVMENGVAETPIGSFHYIYSPNVTPFTTLQALTGTLVTYALAGGTQPTDQNGSAGTLSALNMSFDFSAQAVTGINMTLTTPGTGSINVSSSVISVPIGDLAGPGMKLDSLNNISVTGGYVGQISGTFIGPNAEGLITTYGFREDVPVSTKGVAGTALLCTTC